MEFRHSRSLALLIAALLAAPAASASISRGYSYDANGFIASRTDGNGITTQYSRDAQGRELNRTEAAGTPVERSVSTQWHATLRKPIRVTEPGKSTDYAYDARGLLLSKTETDSANGTSRTRRYAYNEWGQLTEVDGPREDVADITRYRYNDQGLRIATINALGHTTQTTAFDAYGHPLTLVDANGLVTELSYSPRGRLIRRTTGGESTEMAYDGVGNLIRVTAADGSVVNYHYDDARRLTAIEDHDGNRIDYTLDAKGNRTEERVTDPSGTLVRHHRAVYDQLDRLVQSVGAENQTETTAFDAEGNPITLTDANGHATTQAFDPLNRLIRQSDPLGGQVAYGYDPAGHLTSVTAANGAVTSYRYDGLGRRIEEQSPDRGTTTYAYDAADNLISKTDANGNTTTYTYDALNRVTRATYADGTSDTYSYDQGANGIGRLSSVSDPSGTTAYGYDAHGRVTQKSQTLLHDQGETTLTTQYRYDAIGQLTETLYPSGMVVGYAYDAGKLTGLTLNGDPWLSGITYTPFGAVSGWQWANGTASVRGYDLDGRLIGQSLGGAERTLAYDPVGNITGLITGIETETFDYDPLDRLIGAADPTYTLAWSYDANGNRLSETQDGVVTPYTIEAASNRLLAVADIQRSYDANGNTLTDGEHTYTYDARNRLVAVDEGQTGQYRHNALGQRVYKEGKAVPGDADGDGQITTGDLHAVKNGVPIECEGPGKGKGKGQTTACVANQIGDYANNGRGTENGNGQGVQAGVQQGTRKLLFAYDENRYLLGEYRLGGAAEQETVWLGNLPVATIRSGVAYAVHADHLGTPRVITDAANREVWLWDSDPFGVTVPDEDPDGDGVRLAYNLRFPGQYHDAETGLSYNYFRDYNPSIGRYIESDPIGLKGGMNTYGDALQNPVLRVDYDGLDPTQPDYSPCSYYDEMASKNGCKYHAAAAEICRGKNRLVNAITTLCGVTTSQLNCIRKCLVESDKAAQEDPECRTGKCGDGKCTKKSCIDNYHNKCFAQCGVSTLCYGGNWGPYPNDGD